MDPFRPRLPSPWAGQQSFSIYGLPSPASTLPSHLHPWGICYFPGNMDPTTLTAAIEAAFQPALALSGRPPDFASGMEAFRRWSTVIMDLHSPYPLEPAIALRALMESVLVSIEIVTRFVGQAHMGLKIYLAGQLALLMIGLILWRERYSENADLGNQHHHLSQSFGVTVPTVSLPGPAPLLPRVIFPPQPSTADSPDQVNIEPNSSSATSTRFGSSGAPVRNWGQQARREAQPRQPTSTGAAALSRSMGSGLATTSMPTGNGRPVNDYFPGLELASSRPLPGRQEGLNNAAAGITLRDTYPERLMGSYLERDYEPGPLTGFPNSQGRDAGSCHWKGIQSPKSWSYNLNVSPPGEILSRKNILNCLEFRLD